MIFFSVALGYDFFANAMMAAVQLARDVWVIDEDDVVFVLVSRLLALAPPKSIITVRTTIPSLVAYQRATVFIPSSPKIHLMT